MALRFKVEPLQDTIRFTAKGIVVELSYHAASALCNQIAEVIVARKASTTMHQYWMENLRKKKRVNVRNENKEKYEAFLNSQDEEKPDTSFIIPAESITEPQQKQSMERCPSSSKHITMEQRKEAYQKKIRELQTRFGIIPTKKE